MTRSGRRDQALAVVLAALAGFVDATGFLGTGGFFLSFMSGNSTRLGVGLGGGLDGRGTDAQVAAGLIGTFVVGVVAGALAGRAAGNWRRPVVLALVAVLLGAAAWTGQAGHAVIAPGLAVLAMGTENAVFERDGEVSIGLTYMTGTLVKAGQGIAKALDGGPKWAWLPHLLLWAGFVAGVVAGTRAFPAAGLAGLWAPAVLALFLAAVLALSRRARRV